VPSKPDGMVSWDEVRSRLNDARIYWVITVNADGSPQITPVWGTWLSGAVHFSCGDDTQKARNLRRDPRVAIHLDSDQGVVVVHGLARRVADPELEGRVTAALRTKYGSAEIPDTAAELHGSYYEVTPTRVIAWVDFPTDVARFDFP
jgi:PPOX class probable F420-dependent enzyme